MAGFDVARERDQVRRHIGLVFQEPTLDSYLTAEQNLRFHGELYGVDRATAARAAREVLTMVGPVGAARRPGPDLLGRDAAAAGDRPRACSTRRRCCSWTSPPSASTRRPAPLSGTT